MIDRQIDGAISPAAFPSTTVSLRCPFFIEILEVLQMQENSEPLQILVSLPAHSFGPEAVFPHSTMKSHPMEESELSAVFHGWPREAPLGALLVPALLLSTSPPSSTSPSSGVRRSAAQPAGVLIPLCFVFPKQDLEQVQLHLEEVRFFDVFGFSETAGAWQCFMCNNPEKATGECPPPLLQRTSCAPSDGQGSVSPWALAGLLLGKRPPLD